MEPLPPPRPKHPLGCHNPRVPDRAALDGIFFVLRTGSQWGALDATWTSTNALQYMRATFECYESRHGKGYTCQRETLRYDGTLWR